MHTVLIWIICAAGLFGIGYFLIWFPAAQVISFFQTPVSAADIQSNPNTNYSGHKPGTDIPILSSANQFTDGTYNALDFVSATVVSVMPIDGYRLKDSADRNDSSMYLGGRRAFSGTPLEEYTQHPTRRKYLYAQYYILEFSDGTHIGAFMDPSWNVGRIPAQGVQLPIGRLELTGRTEKEWFQSQSDSDSIDADYVLYMFDDDGYKNLKVVDLALRVVASLLLAAVAFVAIILLSKKPFLRRF